MNAANLNSRILVTGAGGHLGRRVVELLLDAGLTNVVAGSRSPVRLDDLTIRGASSTAVDFDNPATLDAAFVGVDRLLIVSTDALAVPGHRLRHHRAAVDAAVRAGVGHIVYTSMANPEPGSRISFAPDHYETEQAIARSGVPYTILRVNWYAEGFFTWLPQALSSGEWITAAGEGRVGYIAREDAARAAAAALLADTTESRTLDVTGPEALAAADVITIVNSVFDASITLVPVSIEERTEGLRAIGLTEPMVALFISLDENVRAGDADVVSDAVERLTEKAPSSVRDFLLLHRADLLSGDAG